jgi:CBS domain-containing protein
MGDHVVDKIETARKRAEFSRHLLNDIEALEIMLEKGMIEDDIVRIGAEQEFCLVNAQWRPSMDSLTILEALNDPHFTTELARYNLEINLDPEELKSTCFADMEGKLLGFLKKAREKSREHQNRIVLTGILPSISKTELEFDYMTPHPRYWALNKAIKNLRRGDFELRLRGVDELCLSHNSVLFEACNTSFQMHLQIKPADFVSSYNWAQAISGPVLGVSTNSPLLLGRELWSETRIALFQQSIDTRTSSLALKDQQSRVSFGKGWAHGSVADIFKNDIAQHPVILSREIEVDSLEELNAGRIPKLGALTMHNGTIYRWNRPCYGVGGGKPHVRIENRYIPSGPTVIDQMANFALWVGLMIGRPKEYNNLQTALDFRDAKSNFINAARSGKDTVMYWKDDRYSVRDLVVQELLPTAFEGLQKAGIDASDSERLLEVIEGRAKGKTGSQWQVKNYRRLRDRMKQDDALLALTQGMANNEQTGLPVHLWNDLNLDDDANKSAYLASHVMSTQLFTVNENDLSDLATSIMNWKGIHHVPVENNLGELSGILTWTHMKRHQKDSSDTSRSLVSDIMTKDVLSIDPSMRIEEAISIMKANEFGCLPVVQDQHLVGIITIKDVIAFDREHDL